MRQAVRQGVYSSAERDSPKIEENLPESDKCTVGIRRNCLRCLCDVGDASYPFLSVGTYCFDNVYPPYIT